MGTKLTKAQFFAALSDKTGLPKAEAIKFYGDLRDILLQQLVLGGEGVAVLPDLVKLTVVDKPAVEARPGRHPFTGEATMFKAKPASRRVKVAAVKSLKDAVG